MNRSKSAASALVLYKKITPTLKVLLKLNKSFFFAKCARKQATETMSSSKLAAIALESCKQDNTSGTSTAGIEQVNVKFANSIGNK